MIDDQARPGPTARDRQLSGPAGRRSLAALLVALVMAVAACSSVDDHHDASGSDEGDARPEVATTLASDLGDEVQAGGTDDAVAAGAAMVDSDTGGDTARGGAVGPGPVETDPLGSGGATVTPTAADLGRQLIFTADVHVEVDDVARASAEATSIVESMGGFLFGQNTTGGAEPSSELTFKVLPVDFNRVLIALGTMGELRNQTITTDDVTERIVDLGSRIQVAELGVDDCEPPSRRRRRWRTTPRSSGFSSTGRPSSRSCGASSAPSGTGSTWPPSRSCCPRTEWRTPSTSPSRSTRATTAGSRVRGRAP